MRNLFAALTLALLPAALAQTQSGYCYALKANQNPSAASKRIPCQIKTDSGANYVITWGKVKHVVRPSTVNDNLILNNLVASRVMLHKDDFQPIPYEYQRDALDGHMAIECFRNSRETVCYALP
ncbi:hypothetical protein [Deinococcus radiophilus]|uniref:DUF3757 domain-containing protein n=1 Tax=Deinococcus radiophilus TaxID=32062 RepID=A0A431VTE8_9DEIO|nr:hypothetical protein [Deinococcus radiophilus]RTR26349.1 hypothetical protein EJ104_08390 [Deinococcus radiophilus]UFA52003.1 hypothetical protein LMT64_13500 [Deinococcus radiophilus]